MREDILINYVDDKELICAICQQVFFKPVKTQCGHNFCGKCISKWMQKKKQCPYCRTEFLNYNFYERDQIMTQRVENLEVTCLKCNIWNGKLVELKNHRSTNCIPNQMQGCSNDFQNIQINLEDPSETIVQEILSIIQQQNYIKLFMMEQEIYAQQSEINASEPKLKKKLKTNKNIDISNQEDIDIDIEVLEDNEINILKNSNIYKKKQINKYIQLSQKFIQELFESKYLPQTKMYFSLLITQRRFLAIYKQSKK